MRNRYLIVGRDADAAEEIVTATAAASGLTAIVETQRLFIFTSPDVNSFVSDCGSVAILGEMFRKDAPYERVRRLGPDEVTALSKDGVAVLAEGFWGHYVAVLTASQPCGEIFRSPFGSLPAYYVRDAAGIVVASDVALLKRCGLARAEVDWRAVARHILRANYRTAETCIPGVEELIGGYALAPVGSQACPRPVWSPWEFARTRDQMLDEEQAASALRTTVNGCIAALSRSSTSILLSVSGGLDSSIVASALANCGARYSCLTLFTSDPGGDERHYAKLLASHLGAQLFEAHEDVGAVDLTRSAAAHLPRPLARGFAQSGDLAHRDVAARIEADTFFHGGGGDNVFCALQSVAPTVDCLRSGRWGRSLTAAADMARIADTSVTEVLRKAVVRALRKGHNYPWRPDTSFLNAAALLDGLAPRAELWPPPMPVHLPGKGTHVAWLVGILNFLEGFERERAYRTVAPLLAQPIVELCLRIPSWLWTAHGRDRYIARKAFADRLPFAIIERRAKGTPDCFVVELLEANRRLIRERLCDGHMAARGLLNRQAIADALARNEPLRDETCWRIMTLVDVESWVETITRDGFAEA